MSDRKTIKVRKNPYRNKKFTRVVRDFEKQGLEQIKLEDELDSLMASEVGQYFRQKHVQLDKSGVIFKGIHGISHSNRVAILAMLIAKKEGTLAKDFDHKIKDILLTAAYYHDIGRKKGPIVVNSGPHAKSSAKKVDKMELSFLDGTKYSEEEKRMVQAIVEAHEGKDEDMEAICKKYKISPANIPLVKELMTIIKDADALDRARLDLGLPLTKPDLNPDYLRTNSAKQFINLSYELEALSKNVSMEEIIESRTKENNDTEIETFAGVFEKVRMECYQLYHDKNLREGKVDSKEAFFEILDAYLQTIIPEKSKLHNLVSKTTQISKRAAEHLTGDYQIGIGDIDFEELVNHAETLSSIIAYSNQEELDAMLSQASMQAFANGVVDGAVANKLIPSEGKEEIAKSNFQNCSHGIKSFFKNSIYNITHLNEKVANIIAHMARMDREESKELNGNLLGKAVGGLAYELLSGTLINKRHFTQVTNSKSMLEKIEQEGILHFSSPETAKRIMQSSRVKKTNFLESDFTKEKSFFFAGVPTFEDLLINIPAYDVMTAVRIKPSLKQIKDLKYRAINDRTVVKDGDFRFNKNQAEIVHFGLKWDEEKKQIYLGELTKEEAKDFRVSDEVRNAYHYEGKKSKLSEKAKMNIYGLYAEYKHHQKLLQMEQILRENGVIDLQNVNDRTLVELSDIEQAYVDTKDKSVERRSITTLIKATIGKYKQKDKIKEDVITTEEKGE